MFSRNVLCDVFRDIGGEQVLPLPHDELRRVSRAYRIRHVKAGGIFLRDARKNALAACPFDPRADAGKFLFKSLADLLSELKISRRR